jgi:hypothetical protein
MNTQLTTRQLPTIEELVQDTEVSINENKLTVLLNQQPHAPWIKKHPMATTKDANGQTVPSDYLPIDKVEFLLTKIYGKWWVEILDSKIMANSCCVTVRLFVKNPITGETEHNDGVGAKSIQTDKGAGAMDWNAAKDSGVMMALPSAETYAIKDAAEKFGRIFGRDLNRREQVSYIGLMKDEPVTLYDLQELFELKRESITDTDFITNVERIISNNETDKFKPVFNKLKSL